MSDEHFNTHKEGKEKMVLKAVYFDPSMWRQARQKAGLTPLAAIIRKLLRLWLQGKINLDNYED